MSKYIVRLTDGTVGEMYAQQAEPAIGDIIQVKLHDENGNLIKVDGIIDEILEETNY